MTYLPYFLNEWVKSEWVSEFVKFMSQANQSSKLMGGVSQVRPVRESSVWGRQVTEWVKWVSQESEWTKGVKLLSQKRRGLKWVSPAS